MPRLAPVTRTALSAIVIHPVVIVTLSCICLGGARRAQSPLLEVVIRRKAAIHRPPRKLRLAQAPPCSGLDGDCVPGGAVRAGPRRLGPPILLPGEGCRPQPGSTVTRPR